MRKILIGVSAFVLLFVFAARFSRAASDKNPFYQTIADLESYVDQRFDEVWAELVRLPDSLSALAYRVTQNESDIALFRERADNLEKDVDLLTTGVDGNTTDIGLLDDRVSNLEGSLSPEPATATFAEARSVPFNSDWVDILGYQALTMEVYSSLSIVQYAMHYTNDPARVTNTTGFIEQGRVWCSGATCPFATFPVMGRYYRISIGTATGDVTARGYLTP